MSAVASEVDQRLCCPHMTLATSENFDQMPDRMNRQADLGIGAHVILLNWI